jgi:hypothetical protein
VIKGWLISSTPSARTGDTTPWYSSFWEFCARYCQARFAEEWHLSPEQSLLLHAENTVIPSQTVVISPRAANNWIELLFGTSLYDLKQPSMPRMTNLVMRDGLRIFSAAAALVGVSEAFFKRNPAETRVVLAGIRDASEVLRRLLEGGRSVVAGRLAGAFRHGSRPELADEILATMKSAGYDVRETDPFAPQKVPAALPTIEPPTVGRVRAMWESMRDRVLKIFPEPPGIPQDREKYLQSVDDIYRDDAYHSLSIEGYTVSAGLIERVHQ